MLDPTYIDCYSNIDAPYQRLDARTKIVTTVIFVVVMMLSSGDSPLRALPFFLFVFFLAVFSRLSPKVLVRRTLPAVPFILTASLVLGFSKGAYPAVAALTKALLSVLSAVILVSTTRFSDLLKGLEGLKIPTIIVSMIAFIYRYFFIISDEYGHIKIARESRNFGGNRRWQWRTIGHSIGTLFLHSYERGERVYSAMVARGYDGNIRSMKSQRIGAADAIFACIAASYIIVVVIMEWVWL